jgi:hypothetical protein
MHSSIKFSFITLAAVVSSMIFVTGAITLAQAQGFPIVPKITRVASAASMSGMNMSGAASMPGQSIVRDSVTLLLEGKTIPGKGFIHLYDAAPYMIHNGHVGIHVPCDTSSKLVVNLLVGQANGTFTAIQPRLWAYSPIKELSIPGQMCLAHVSINSDMAMKLYITDLAIQNPSNQTIIFPPTSTVVVGVNGLMPIP